MKGNTQQEIADELDMTAAHSRFQTVLAENSQNEKNFNKRQRLKAFSARACEPEAFDEV